MSNQPNHADRGHAEFSPSSLKYVKGCPAYKGKEGSSAAAEMGTRIHEALEIRDPSALHDENEVDLYERCAEMEDDFLAEIFGAEPTTEYKEIQVDIELFGTSTFGTCDRLSISECGEYAVMGDYKTGISLIDPPAENEQAIAYVIGAFQKFESLQRITFAFYVPQRSPFPMVGEFSRDQLESLTHEVSEYIKRAEETRPLWAGGGCPPPEACNPSQYCRFCQFEHRCPALGGLVVDVVSNIQRKDFTNIDLNNLSDPRAMEELYRIATIAANWAKEYKKRVTEAAKAGVEFPSLKVTEVSGRRYFSSPQKVVELASEHGVSPEDLLEVSSLPLGAVGKLFSERGVKDFLGECETAGAIEKTEDSIRLS